MNDACRREPSGLSGDTWGIENGAGNTTPGPFKGLTDEPAGAAACSLQSVGDVALYTAATWVRPP